MDSDTFITIVCLVIAVIVFLQLRSVLGKRTGNERQPYDPFAAQPAALDTGQEKNAPSAALPTAKPRIADDFSDIDKVAAQDSALNNGLRTIRSLDSQFEPKSFIDGARLAYEMIVTAFAANDLKTLKPLLTKDVFDGFANAVEERQKRGETIKFTFVGISKCEFSNAYVEGSEGFITIRLVSEMISATYDKAKQLIDGDSEAIIEVHDRWTFKRDTKSSNPNWQLAITEDDT